MHRFEIHSVIASIQVRYDLKSQPAVARFLGITEKTLSNWMHHRNYPDARMCALLAERADVDPDVLTAYNEALRAHTPEARATWQRIVRRLAGPGETEIFSGAAATKRIAALTSLAPA